MACLVRVRHRVSTCNLRNLSAEIHTRLRLLSPRDYVTAHDLDTWPAAVRQLFPHAIEYTTLNNRPCWLVADLLGIDPDS